MQIAFGYVRVVNYPPPQTVFTQTHTHSRCTKYRVCYGEKNCSVGFLPNIIGVRGYTCSHCMSTFMWVETNRKLIDD